MKPTDEVIKLRKLSQRFAYTSIQMHEAVGRQAGLPGTDHKYLGFLIQRGQMTAGEFATITGLTTGAVTSLIDRLEHKQLLKRQPDPGDRRKVVIVPDAEKIASLLVPLYQDFQDATDQLFAKFSSEERVVLEKYFVSAMEVMKGQIDIINQKQ